MNKKTTALIRNIALFLIALVAFLSVYYVHEGEYAIIKRFDKVVAVRQEAGLGFKIPTLDKKSSLSKKLSFYDVSPSEVITRDKKSMIVDTYAIWKITDPLKFLQTAGNTNEIERRLEATIYGSLKTTIGALDQMDIVKSRTNNGINEAILKNSANSLTNYGIELIDVQIKRFDLPSSNKAAVFDRMISERNQIVATFLAEGQEEANKIRNTADKEKSIIVSEAKAKSAKLGGEGESEYMRILNSAYSNAERADFYAFIRGLDALKVTMKGDKTVILSDDSQLTRHLNGR